MLRTLVARLFNPVVWRIPGHPARKLRSFALAEQGSMLDIKAAARLTDSLERRAAYVRHFLDESRHAQMFALRSAELQIAEGRSPGGPIQADTEDLFRNLGEVRFLAFVHRGETRGRRQFEVYRDWFERHGDRKTSAMFATILKDERRHESYSWELLVELTGSELAAKHQLKRAAAWEAWRTWRRMGRFLAERLYSVLSIVLYLLLFPFALWARLARPAKVGWGCAERATLRFPFAQTPSS